MIKFKGQLIIKIVANMNDDYFIQLFAPLTGAHLIYDNTVDNSFPPLLTKSGIDTAIIAGGANISYVGADEFGNIQGRSSGGGFYFFIQSLKYPYTSFLEWLKSASFKISRVHIDTNTPAQLSMPWKVKRTYPNGNIITNDIENTNNVSPENVQPGITEYEFDLTINRFTELQIATVANSNTTYTFEIQEL